MGKEYADSIDPTLFASTPPMEGLRYVISSAATRQPDDKEKKVVMINDVSRAYFHARATRRMYVEILAEDKQTIRAIPVRSRTQTAAYLLGQPPIPDTMVLATEIGI